MCTFIVAWQVFANAPVVVAANRDERFDREARPPGVLDTEPRVVAPQDRKARGTWIGYNEHGLIASITNRWTDADLAGDRSRGLLVREALSRTTTDAVVSLVERTVRENDYEGFHLVALDADRAVLCAWDGDLSVRELDPGVHVVVNVGADHEFRVPESRAQVGRDQARRTERAFEELQPGPEESLTDWRERAIVALRDHDYGFCVHDNGFGTRSSSVLTLTDNGVEYRFADGPPCRTPYEPIER